MQTQELQEFRSWSGSPVGLDCARVGNNQLGDLFQKGLHIYSGGVSQILECLCCFCHAVEIELLSQQVNTTLYSVLDKIRSFPYCNSSTPALQQLLTPSVPPPSNGTHD